MKKLFFLALLFAASCTSVEENPAPDSGNLIIRIQAEYADGTTEHSSLIVIK